MGDECQGLQGLAQAHVVGEDPAEVALVQQRQPPESLHLVGPHGDAVQVRDFDGGQVVEVEQCLRGFLPGLGGQSLIGELLELRPQAHMQARDLGRLGFPLGDEIGLGQECLEFVEGGFVQRQERVVDEFDLLRPRRQGFVELDEGDGLAVDGDLEAEVEPVVLLRLDRGDRDVRFPAELTIGLLLPARDDLDVLDLLEPGQDVDDEVRGVDVGELHVAGVTRRLGLSEDGRDLVEHAAFMLKVAIVARVWRRSGAARARCGADGGGAEFRQGHHGQGPARSRVLPVPLQAQVVLCTVDHEEDQPRLAELGKLHRFVGADDLGGGAQQWVVLLEEFFGLVRRDRDWAS